MFKYIFLLFALQVICISSRAQERVVNNTTIMWDQYFLEATINPKWSLYFDGGARFYNFYETHFLTQFRPGVIYKPSPKWDLGAGYSMFITHPGSFIENRPWQQVVRKDSFGKLQISQRIRTEQRYIDSAKGRRNVFRARYQLSALYPVLRNSNKIMYSIYQEIMPVWGDATPQNHLDQYRFYAGFNYSFNTFTATAGYQYIWQWTTQTNAFNRSHCLRLTLVHKLSFE